jgi:hypothetical protein
MVNKISGQVAYTVMSFGGFLSNRRKFSSVGHDGRRLCTSQGNKTMAKT